MPKLEFTPDELKQFFTGKKFNHYSELSKEKEAEMRVHSDGVFPEKLIDERRPNEPETVLAYRKSIFVPKTKPYFGKVESTLQKIRRSSDWSIKYSDSNFDKVVDGEKMDDYAERNYPVFQSVTNWAFSLLLRNYLIDVNGILLIGPIEIPTEENKYLKPVGTIFNSADVIYYEEGDYAILKNKVGVIGKDDWESFYVVTTEYTRRYDQINNRKQFAVEFEYYHNLGELPCFILGGIVIDVYGLHTLYESRISGILPEFNEALREYSDLQAAKVLHLYPERWEYTQNECVSCKGTGQRMGTVDGNACQVTCDSCKGVGYIATGPYSKMLIKPAAADQLAVPTPPAGFVEKDVEIIKVQEQSVHDHIYNGLSSINFEFLAERPMATSGIKTAMDGDELNNTVHAVAEDLVRIIDRVYYYIALYRYRELYTVAEIKDMLPMIAVPEKYDILGTKYFDEQITSAKANKLNPAILNAMEIAYATKAFNNDLEIAEHVSLILKLDPLSGILEDDKMSRLSNEGITKLDYIVSSNINKFVNQAVEDNYLFVDLETKKQKEIIYGMAQEQIDSNTATLIPQDAFNNQNNN